MKDLTMDPIALSQFIGEPSKEKILSFYLPQVKNQAWQNLINTFIMMKEPITCYAHKQLSKWNFEVAPGSGAHHCHYGGLALHVLQNLEYAESWIKVYQSRGLTVNTELIYATILLHDLMKKFIYKFDENYTFIKSEDAFIAQKEDHHSWVLRELKAHNCSPELLLSVAAIHGIDDVSLQHGVTMTSIVNHYLTLGNTGIIATQDDIRPEHVISFLADSDWHWSAQAQRKSGILAEKISTITNQNSNAIKLYLGSFFSFEKIGYFIEKNGYDVATNYFVTKLEI